MKRLHKSKPASLAEAYYNTVTPSIRWDGMEPEEIFATLAALDASFADLYRDIHAEHRASPARGEVLTAARSVMGAIQKLRYHLRVLKEQSVATRTKV